MSVGTPVSDLDELVTELTPLLPPGPTGPTGPQGPAGADGADGLNGADGADGVDGVNGTNGVDGADGADGAQGPIGPIGPQGPAGNDGADGTNGTNGTNGTDGVDGVDGDSAYEVAVANGFVGTEAAWLTSLIGATGPQGIQGIQGPAGNDGADGTNGTDGINGTNGADGADGADGTNGVDGVDGDSAYEVAVANGFVGSEAAWLTSLIGATGPQGPQGIQGIQGIPGNDGADGADGTNGTNGIDGVDGADGATGPQGPIGPIGPQGPAGNDGADGADGTNGVDGTNGTNGTDGVDGDSAYEVAVANGFVGSEAAWLTSLIGATGPQGIQGIQGPAGNDGVDGTNGTNGTNGVDGVDGATGPQGPIGPIGPQGPAGTDGVDGANGTDGADGADGVDGVNAYDAAVGAGYTGTETEFNTDLAGISDLFTPWTEVSPTVIQYGNVIIDSAPGTGCAFDVVNDTGADVCNTQIGGFGSAFNLLRKALGAIGAETALTNGSKIGGQGFAAHNGTDYYVGAEMSAYVTEDHTPTAGGTELHWQVTPNGTVTQITAMQLLNNGDLQLNLYPDTRDDGARTSNKFLTVDDTGNVRHQARYVEFARLTTPTGNQTTGFLEALNLQCNIPYDGDYKVTVSYTWSANTTGSDFISRVQRDNVTTIFEHEQEPKDPGGPSVVVQNLAGGTFNSGTSQRHGWCQTDIQNFTAGIHNIDLDIRGSIAGIEPTIYYATIIVEEI